MITGLESYVGEHRLAAPVDLAGAVIGLDGDSLAAGDPSTVLGAVKAAGATPVVVFDGPAKRAPGRADGLAARRLQKRLLQDNFRFLVAPGMAGAQLAYLAKTRYVSHVSVAASDAWLFGDVPLVLGLDVASSEKPQAVTRATVMAHLRVAEPQFVELALAAGSGAMAEQFPLLDRHQNALAWTAQYVALGAGQGSMLRAAAATDGAYLTRFQAALGTVVWHPVLTSEGSVELPPSRVPGGIPRDLHEIVGRQLPDQVFWHVTKGLVGVELVRALLYGEFEDDPLLRPSLGSAAASEYAELQRKLVPVRRQALALLIVPLHRYFRYKDVESRTEGVARLERIEATHVSAPEAAEDASAVVKAAVDHVHTVTQVAAGKNPVDVLLGTHSPELRPVVQLALRELAEAAVYVLIESGKVPHTIDTAAVVKQLPFL